MMETRIGIVSMIVRFVTGSQLPRHRQMNFTNRRAMSEHKQSHAKAGNAPTLYALISQPGVPAFNHYKYI
jgi:hypothetical protein